LLVRNLERTDLPVYSVKGHKEIINAIDGVGGLGVGDGAPEIVTSSRDGRTWCMLSFSLLKYLGVIESESDMKLSVCCFVVYFIV